MDNLLRFLQDRLDEDGRIAREACHGRTGSWVTNDTYPVSVSDVPAGASVFDKVVAFDEGSPSEAQAEHMARHDPARVLAEVEAKRQLLAKYQEVADNDVDQPYEYAYGYANALGDAVCLMSLPYADHPDYKESWRP